MLLYIIDFDMNGLVSPSSPKLINTQPNVPSSYHSLETVSPGVQRAKKNTVTYSKFQMEVQ